jgi:hypothetical protein
MYLVVSASRPVERFWRAPRKIENTRELRIGGALLLGDVEVNH